MKNLRHLLRRVRPMLSRNAQDFAKGSDGRSRLVRNNKRRLLSETLEKRQLFAGDVGDVLPESAPAAETSIQQSRGHNYWNKYDVDNNGQVTALDALRIINHLNSTAEGEPVEMGADTTGFVDVNEDFIVTPLDALMVINRLNAAGEPTVPEDQDAFDVQFRIQPRDLDDNLLTTVGTYTGQNDTGFALPGTSDIYTIEQGEIFKIEVGAMDNRGRTSRDGLFQSVVNVLIEESGKIEPVIGEVQGADLPEIIIDDVNPPNGTVTFFYEGNENNVAEQRSTSITNFVGQSDVDVINFVRDTIVALNDNVDSPDEITVTAGIRPESGFYQFRVAYTDIDLAGQDIPRLITQLEIDGAQQQVVIIEDNVEVNGVFNPEALKGNLEVLSRNSVANTPAGADPDFDGPGRTDGTPFYGVLRSGRFIVNPGGADVFEEIGASGGIRTAAQEIGPLRNDIFYDTFSIIVRAVAPADDLIIKATPALERAATATLPVFEGVLLYGSSAGNEKVAEEDLRFDQDAQFQLIITSSGQDSITAPNESLTIAEGAANGIRNTNASSTVAGTITYAIVTNGSRGTASIDANGQITYVPNDDNVNGPDVIVYSATIATANGPITDTGTLNVTITPVNDTPVANDDNGGTVTVGQAPLDINVLVNDDAGGGNEPISELTISVMNTGADAPTLGTVAVVNTTAGTRIRYTPNAGAASGTDTFTYTITDTGGLSDTAVVTVNVVNNSIGVSADDFTAAAIDEDSPVTQVVDLVAQGLLTAVTGSTNFVLDSAVSNQGTVTRNGLVISFQPNANFNGTATITYTVSNEVANGADSGVITIPVTSINDLPVAPNLDFTLNERSVRTINVLQPGVGNTAPSDVEDATSQLTVQLPVQTFDPRGSVRLIGNLIEVTSNQPESAGDFSFQYRVVDTNGGATSGTIDIDVIDVQDPPVASDTTVTGTEDGANVVVDLDSLTTVENNVAITYSVISFDAADLTAAPTIDANNNLIIDPAANFNGPTTITYRATVGNQFDEGVITVNVSAVNDLPTIPATFPQQFVLEDSTLDIDILAQANDVDGDILTAAVATNPTNGTVTPQGNGVFRYTPAPDFNGSDSFTATVSDGNGGQATTTINITVTDTVSAPVANDSTLNAVEDGGVVTLNLTGLVDLDPGDTATITLTMGASNGTATITNGVLSYTPNLNYNGPDSITYTATSTFNTALSDTGVISITVGSINDNPIANDDMATTSRGQSIAINVLANDNPDPAGENQAVVVSVAAGNGPSNGTVTIANNVITYTPNAGFADATDTFTYTLTDSEGGSDTAEVQVRVNDFATRTVSGQLFQDTADNITDVIQSGADPVGNGIKDDDEMGLGGVAVRLQSLAGANASGQIVSLIAITDRDGNYQFEDVPVGTQYTLDYDLPADMVLLGGNSRSISFAVNEDVGGTGAGALNANLGLAGLGSMTPGGYNVISTSPGLEGQPLDTEVDELSSFFFTQSAGLGLAQSASLIGAGFEDALYVELALNSAGDQALLTVIDANARVQSAIVDSDRLQLRFAEDGSSARARVFGAAEDFNFVDDLGDVVDDFPGYQAAIDQILSGL